VGAAVPPEYCRFISRDAVRDGAPWRSWDFNGIRVSWPLELVAREVPRGPAKGARLVWILNSIRGALEAEAIERLEEKMAGLQQRLTR
jgi:hypothetical protein